MNNNENYLKQFSKTNPGFENNQEAYIMPTIKYIQKKIIQTTYNFNLVYNQQKNNETISIENFHEIRDKLMFLVMLPKYKESLYNYLDGVCEFLQLEQQQYLCGEVEIRLRYIALYVTQLYGVVGPTSFDLKTVEGNTLPGEPVATMISKITVDILYEFTNITSKDDTENIFKTLLSVMAYLVLFRIKTDWGKDRIIK